jgi:hypothetical protein
MARANLKYIERYFFFERILIINNQTHVIKSSNWQHTVETIEHRYSRQEDIEVQTSHTVEDRLKDLHLERC